MPGDDDKGQGGKGKPGEGPEGGSPEKMVELKRGDETRTVTAEEAKNLAQMGWDYSKKMEAIKAREAEVAELEEVQKMMVAHPALAVKVKEVTDEYEKGLLGDEGGGGADDKGDELTDEEKRLRAIEVAVRKADVGQQQISYNLQLKDALALFPKADPEVVLIRTLNRPNTTIAKEAEILHKEAVAKEAEVIENYNREKAADADKGAVPAGGRPPLKPEEVKKLKVEDGTLRKAMRGVLGATRKET